MDDEGDLTDASHWADNPVSTFATGCDDHDFRSVKGGAVVVEKDATYDDALQNVEEQDNPETSDNTASLDDSKLPVDNDNSIARPDLRSEWQWRSITLANYVLPCLCYIYIYIYRPTLGLSLKVG